MNIVFEDATDYLIVRVEGEWTTDTMHEAIKNTAKEARKRGFQHIFADCRKLHAPETALLRFKAGQDVAQHFAHDLKLAVLYPKDLINKLAENVAVSWGAFMAVFFDLDEALSWLKEGERQR
jgi:hypothetical protein